MTVDSGDPLSGIPVTVPPDFDVDEGPCVVCGGSLDTGWECNECGADHMPAVQALLKRRRLALEAEQEENKS